MKMSARQRRRKALDALIPRLETLADAERDYLETIPVTPPNGNRYLDAERTVSALENALSSLYLAYMPVEQYTPGSILLSRRRA